MVVKKPFHSQIKIMSNYGYTGHVWRRKGKENNYWQKQWSCRIKMEHKKYIKPAERWWDTFSPLL